MAQDWAPSEGPYRVVGGTHLSFILVHHPSSSLSNPSSGPPLFLSHCSDLIQFICSAVAEWNRHRRYRSLRGIADQPDDEVYQCRRDGSWGGIWKSRRRGWYGIEYGGTHKWWGWWYGDECRRRVIGVVGGFTCSCIVQWVYVAAAHAHGHGHRTYYRPRRIALSPRDQFTLTNGRLVLLDFWIELVDWRNINVTKEQPRVFRLEFERHIFGRLYVLTCHLWFWRTGRSYHSHFCTKICTIRGRFNTFACDVWGYQLELLCLCMRRASWAVTYISLQPGMFKLG